MRKKIVFMLLFFFAVVGSYANEVRKVKLDNEHTEKTESFGFCNVSVTKKYSDENGNTLVEVEIDNIDGENIIVLFGHDYSERELKKLPLSISLDSSIPGTKGERSIQVSKDVPGMQVINPNEKKKLKIIEIKDGEERSCRLPFYIARYNNKRKTKIRLIEVVVEELIVEVESRDEDYIRLESECDSLIGEISKQTFCNHPRHRISLESQEAPYKTRIDKIKAEIEEIQPQKGFSFDRGYQRYDDLKQKLDAIDFTAYEGDCGNPRNHKSVPSRSRHSCKYCNSSLQQIYHYLDDYYKKIYNRKTTKESVMADVNLLYKCCTDSNCSKHASLWNSSEYKSKIIDRYNRISNF